ALTLAQCDRVTHISHGGESDQTDLGAGRVMWIDWWSQEGTAKDVTIMDCASGAALRFRTAETNMTRGRTPFDKTDQALAVIALHESGARVFATFDRMATDLDSLVRDMTQFDAKSESCACAALYPDMRNDKDPFDLAASTAPTSFTSKP
ncbi:MAG: hypothetical protein AAFW64_11455, partial [Pseudomonadota bacterium]